MTAFVLSPRAREDLSQIWDYTAHHWGKDQADLYVRKIIAVCADLAAGRRQGRSAEAIRAGYLKCTVGSHVLFYRFSDTGEVHVVRVAAFVSRFCRFLSAAIPRFVSIGKLKGWNAAKG